MPTTVILRLPLHDIVLTYLRNSEIRREGPRAWNRLPTELMLMRSYRHYVYEVKFNEDVVSHDYKMTVFINLLLLQFLSRIVGLFCLTWSHLRSDVVNYKTLMRSDVPRCGN